MALVALLFLFLGFPDMLLASASSETQTLPATAPTMRAPIAGRATLSIKSMRPVVVAGRGFRSGESVRVSGIGTKRVRASSAGTFTVNLGGATDRCGFTLVAIGSRGSRASLNFSQLLCLEQ